MLYLKFLFAKIQTFNKLMCISLVIGRPPKNRICTWCAESRQPLKYILPTQHGKKEFCSETCLSEFRKAYNKVNKTRPAEHLKDCVSSQLR